LFLEGGPGWPRTRISEEETAAYGNRDALQIAENLDSKVETLLREAAA